MKLPLSIVRSYVHLEASTAEIADALTLLGIEVEGMEGDVLDLSFTPNLGHCLSAFAIARELAAYFRKPLHTPRFHHDPLVVDPSLRVVNRDYTLCPRYLCRKVKNIVVGTSPEWLKKILEQAGYRPINCAVDIANYIMLKTGQPFHFFDFDLLEGGALEVGPAHEPQTFLGLDQIERSIPAGTLLISDKQGPVAIAGCLGGARTAVSENTRTILVEAAYFRPESIRATCKALRFRTESSLRFEKGIDPNVIEHALDEACALLTELCGGHAERGTVNLTQQSFLPKLIPCRTQRVNQVLGTHLQQEEIAEILRHIDCPCVGEVATVPFYRRDLTEEIDLVSEVARLYGHHRVEKKAPLCITSPVPNDPLYLFDQQVRSLLVGAGLQEMITSNLIGPQLAQFACADTPAIRVLHPKSEEHSLLRPSLLPGLLQAARLNADHQILSYRAFEMGKIYLSTDAETLSAALLFVGKSAPDHWSRAEREDDFFDLKGVLEQFFHALHLRCLFTTSNYKQFHPVRQAHLQIGDRCVGSMGEIRPGLVDHPQRIFCAEIDLEALHSLLPGRVKMHAIPQLPSSTRDWTRALPLRYPIQALFDLIRSYAPPRLEKVELIDLYMPDGATQKNATFRFIYRDLLKTLSYEEVEAEHTKLLTLLANCSLKE